MNITQEFKNNVEYRTLISKYLLLGEKEGKVLQYDIDRMFETKSRKDWLKVLDAIEFEYNNGCLTDGRAFVAKAILERLDIN